MDARRQAKLQAEESNAQYWRRLLYNRVPLAGDWLRGRALKGLEEMISQGAGPAAAVLAEACDRHSDEATRGAALRLLENAQHTICWEAAWQAWAETRGQRLQELLTRRAFPATRSAATRVLSALLLDQESALRQASAAMVDPLIQAYNDRDELIRGRARFALARLERLEAIQAVCARWADSREKWLGEIIQVAGYLPENPPAARLLVALANNRLDVITGGGAELMEPLIQACNDSDPEMQIRARFCLANLNNPAAVNALCSQWARERSGLLEDALLRARYVAARPAAVRALTALKTGRQDVATNLPASSVSFLLSALKDPDEVIARQAGLALRHLTRPDARDALCGLVVEVDDPIARQICLEAGYQPVQAEQRALFLFLTGQTAAYERLDFDQGMLNAVYTASPAPLRQRILQAVQQAGRTDFLTILTGADLRAQAGRLNSIESQLLVRVLTGNQEWGRLWQLAQELAVSASAEIVRSLVGCGWRPPEPEQMTVFSRLAELASERMIYTGSELAAALPPAVARARLKMSGRIADLAFSDHEPVLAIGTGARTLIYWNYQRGLKKATLRGFDHTVGQVAYLPGGRLMCAERTTGNGACGVYLTREEQIIHIGQHLGSVTALEPAGDECVLTTGRDQMAAIWNITQGCVEIERALPYWARAACIAPDHSEAILLHNRLSRFSLPSLSPQGDLLLRGGKNGASSRSDTAPTRSMIRCAAFGKPGDALVVGQHNGQVVLVENQQPRPTARLLTRFGSPVTAIRTIEGRAMIIAGDTAGDMRLMAMPTGQGVGSLRASEGRLTSLHVSPDGSYLATGADNSHLTLWDLRVNDIPRLLERPVAAAQPADITLVNVLVEYELPAGVRNSLRYLQTLLQLRFRFDVHLAETVGIQAGEFDVLID